MDIFTNLNRDVQMEIIAYLDQNDLFSCRQVNKTWHGLPFLVEKYRTLHEWMSERADFYQVSIENQVATIHKNGEFLKNRIYSEKVNAVEEVIEGLGKEDDIVEVKHDNLFLYSQYHANSVAYSPMPFISVEWYYRRNLYYWNIEKFPFPYPEVGKFNFEKFQKMDFEITFPEHQIQVKFQYRYFSPKFGIHLAYNFRILFDISDFVFQDHPSTEEEMKDGVYEHFISISKYCFWHVKKIDGMFSALIY